MSEMPVRVVRMIRLNGAGSVKGFCDLAINEWVIIRGCKVVDGQRGLFVSMPREQGRNGMWYEVVTPMNRQAKEAIQATVLAAYHDPMYGHGCGDVLCTCDAPSDD